MGASCALPVDIHYNGGGQFTPNAYRSILANYICNYIIMVCPPSFVIDAYDISLVAPSSMVVSSSIPDRGCMIPLSNLRGSRMARAAVCSLPLANNAMHSPTIAGKGCGKLSVTRGFFLR